MGWAWDVGMGHEKIPGIRPCSVVLGEGASRWNQEQGRGEKGGDAWEE